MKRTLNYLWHRIAGLRKDSEGFVVMSTLAIFLFIFVLCAFVYAVGETIHHGRSQSFKPIPSHGLAYTLFRPFSQICSR